MEASDTTPPPADPPPADPPQATPPAPPPPPAPPADDGKASGGLRALAVLLALALAFGAAVMIVLALNPDDTPRCEQIQFGECFDVTKTQQAVQAGFAWAAGIIGGLAVVVALFFAATGRRGNLLMRLTVASLVLGAITVLIGQL